MGALVIDDRKYARVLAKILPRVITNDEEHERTTIRGGLPHLMRARQRTLASDERQRDRRGTAGSARFARRKARST